MDHLKVRISFYKIVIIGTSLGFIFIFDKFGQEKKGDNFPLHVGEIQSQIITEDINNDGDLEMCVVDFKSNFVCFNYKGEEIWERIISGYSNQSPVLADINNDGILDLIVGTSTGHIWALNGNNGTVISNFPIKTGSMINSQPIILQIKNVLNIIVPSHDGYLYIINTKSFCIDKIDIGEKSYTQVLGIYY
jgi:outer membrane protein assembly factor BamB